MSYLKQIDIDEYKRLNQKESARQLKREYIKQGYTNQISLYGALKDNETKNSHGVRIEILSNQHITETLMFYLYEFFDIMKPHWSLSIWIYDQFRESVKLVGKYE